MLDMAKPFDITLKHRRHGLTVQSVAILLRSEADGPAMTGSLQRTHPPDREYLGFRYDMLRLWQMPVESLLWGGLGTMPLAPLAAGAEAQLEDIVEQMYRQVTAIGDSTEQGSLWAAAFVLMGLKYSRATAETLFKGVRTMEESVTYQAIIEKGFTLGIAKGRDEGLAKGHVEAARDLLLEFGTKRFGSPSPAILKALNEISDYEQLKRLATRLDEIKGWNSLLVS